MEAESKHARIKKDIEEYFNFFEDNIKRHKQSTRFAFKQTLSEEERQILEITQKPPIEINYTQAYLSRLLGEFSKQTPEISVSGNGTGDNLNVMTVELVEGIIRDIFDQYEKKGSKNQVLKEQCGGGFSVLKVRTKYRNDETFEQDIILEKAKDPVMCFFDPMSKRPSKSDGKYCGEVYPMTKKEFKRKYPKFSQQADNTVYEKMDGYSFSWSYRNMEKEIVILSEYYCVEYKKYNLLKLADGSSIRESDYNKLEKEWGESNLIPMPAVVKRRKIRKKEIKRYVVFGKDIIEEETTSLPGLPYVFVDGDSSFVYRNDTGGEIEQVVHSYIYNAMDAQRLLNYTCQTIANYSENLMQQRYILEERSLVNEDDWISPQRASLLLYKSQDGEGNQIPPPQPVVQAGLPDAIMQTFASMQQTMQNTLGSYDAMLGINQGDLSGVAIQEGATQNNAVAMPFINSYLDALNAVGFLIIKMIPRYYITPMTVPSMDVEGERTFFKINQEMSDGSKDQSSIHIDYGDNDLDVSVTSGYNFTIQKDKSLKVMTQLMQSIPSFAQLMNEKGLPVLIDNLEIRGVDKLKEMAKEQQEQQNQQQNQPNPAQQQAMMKQQEMAMQQQKIQMDMQMKQQELQMKQKQLDNEKILAEMNFYKSYMNDTIQHEKVQAEIGSKKIESAKMLADHALKQHEQLHKHTMDVSTMHR